MEPHNQEAPKIKIRTGDFLMQQYLQSKNRLENVWHGLGLDPIGFRSSEADSPEPTERIDCVRNATFYEVL